MCVCVCMKEGAGQRETIIMEEQMKEGSRMSEGQVGKVRGGGK